MHKNINYLEKSISYVRVELIMKFFNQFHLLSVRTVFIYIEQNIQLIIHTCILDSHTRNFLDS